MQPENIPKKIGKYDVLSVLGRGGMGVVYRGQDPFIGRPVAIKTVTEAFIRDPLMLRRFYSEAEKTGMLAHPNIVIVYDVGEHDGYPYIVMQFIEGDPLDKLIKGNAPLPLIDKLKIMEQVCAALGYAHQRAMIHRDVKPANIIVQPDGVAKLLDFGIARWENVDRDLSMTQPGNIIGTVPYMAPERLNGRPLDGRSDVFAAGVVLFQLLTGRLPFEGEEMALCQKLLHSPHPPLSSLIQDYPIELEQVLDRALAKEPPDRYATAEEMAAELCAIIRAQTEGQVAEMLDQAEQLAADADFPGAKKLLLQILKLEGQNRRARALLGEVQEHFQRRQKVEQVHSLLGKARDALAGRNLDEAVVLLEQAERIAPGDTAVIAQLETARSSKLLHERIDGYLRQAEAARSSGNFPAARSILEKALELDTGNSRLRSVHASLVRQAEENTRRERMKGIFDRTRRQIDEQKYQDALTTLTEAEELDALDPELQTLLQTARTSLRDAQRRRVVEEVEQRAHAASSPEEIERAAALVARALDTMPYDSALLRIQAELQRQQRLNDEQRLLDETVRRCRALEADPVAALAVAREAMVRLPGNERLHSLQSALEARLASQSREQRRAEQLSTAREALTRRDFTGAIRVLSVCQQEGYTEDTAHLLQLAEAELLAQRRQKLLSLHYLPAETLLRAGDHASVVALLTPALAHLSEPRLQALLDRAEAALAEQAHARDQALAQLHRLLAAEAYEELAACAQTLPPVLQHDPAVIAALDQSVRGIEREWEQLHFLGRHHAAHGTSSTSAQEFTARCASVVDSPFLSALFVAAAKPLRSSTRTFFPPRKKS